MRLVEGQIIHRRYRLDTQIAHGGMGEVWKAWDTVLHRTVAVKVLRSDVLSDPQHLARLRAEARNSADLAHPNIAALFDYYEEDGTGFIIMEYVPNESLAQIYKREGRMDPARLLAILSQVARGLYVAHERGVIHRDVKPANIMVAPNGQVKITDFGVSYSTNQAPITAAGMVVGTAQYISPEQAQGKKATPQSDIYSLGVVAYEGLAGHRPFTGATPVDIAAAQVNDPVPPLPADTDPQLAAYVMRMLAKDPARRPRTALDVSHTFSQIERRLVEAGTGTFPAVTGAADASPAAGVPEDLSAAPSAPAHSPVSPASMPSPAPGTRAQRTPFLPAPESPAPAPVSVPSPVSAPRPSSMSAAGDPDASRGLAAHATRDDARAEHRAVPGHAEHSERAEHALPHGSSPRHRTARVVRSAPHFWHSGSTGKPARHAMATGRNPSAAAATPAGSAGRTDRLFPAHGDDGTIRTVHPGKHQEGDRDASGARSGSHQEQSFLARLGERMRHLQEEVADLLSEPDDGTGWNTHGMDGDATGPAQPSGSGRAAGAPVINNSPSGGTPPVSGAAQPPSAPQPTSAPQPSAWQSGTKADTFEKRNEEDPDE